MKKIKQLKKLYNRLKFEFFLWRIGGLVNGIFPNKPPIKSRYFFSVGDGWLPLLKNCIKDSIKAGWDKEICQVKEKFGGLSFYINSGTTEVFNVISKYKGISHNTCEICGKYGKSRNDGWILTLCDKHSKKK